MTSVKPVEVVLPSGRFATCHTITVLDWMAATRATEPMLELAMRCVTIDGEKFSIEQLLELPLEEYWPILNMVAKKLERTRANEEGVK